MNERIKTLCQEAFTEAHESRIGPDGLVRSDGNPYIFYEKFAELIVRECASRVDNILREKKDGGGTMGDEIREHFGVEE